MTINHALPVTSNCCKERIIILNSTLEKIAFMIGKPSHPVKIDLNKMLDPKQKTIQAFNIDA